MVATTACQPITISTLCKLNISSLCSLNISALSKLNISALSKLNISALCILNLSALCNLTISALCNLNIPAICNLNISALCNLNISAFFNLNISSLCRGWGMPEYPAPLPQCECGSCVMCGAAPWVPCPPHQHPAQVHTLQVRYMRYRGSPANLLGSSNNEVDIVQDINDILQWRWMFCSVISHEGQSYFKFLCKASYDMKWVDMWVWSWAWLCPRVSVTRQRAGRGRDLRRGQSAPAIRGGHSEQHWLRSWYRQGHTDRADRADSLIRGHLTGVASTGSCGVSGQI